MKWLELAAAYGLGLMTTVGYGIYLSRRDEVLEDDFDDEEEEEPSEEEDDIIRIIEAIIFFGVEYEDITFFLIHTEIRGIMAIKIVFHELDEETEEEKDIIYYAIADGIEISLVNHSQWAFILGREGVKAVPCIEDLADIEDWNDPEEDDD